MPNYRLQLEYDGRGFAGWQVQPNVRTVQGELQRALAILTRQPIRTAAAGRTDGGVHARGQVVSFQLDSILDCRRIAFGIEGIVGDEISVRRLEEAPVGFHARHDARWRLYSYRLAERPVALWRERSWHPPRFPTLPALRMASAPLLGQHDFTAFANASQDDSVPVCRLMLINWDVWEEGLLLTIQADRFLYRMVRTIVGTLLREALPGGGGAERVEEILRARSRRLAGPSAPTEGLCLEAVGYDPPWPASGAR